MRKVLFVLTTALLLTGCSCSSSKHKISSEERNKHDFEYHPGGTAFTIHDDLNCDYCKELRKKEVIEIVDSILKSKDK